MAVQAVPYALQNASHSAAVFRQSASAPWATGGVIVSGELALASQGTPNMSIILGPGRAKVVGTSVSAPAGLSFTTQAMYDVLNDANLTLTVTTANATNPRIDAVWIGVQDAFYTGAANTALSGVTAGVPAATPVAPAVPVNSQLLGYIAVAANATTIVSGNITSTTPTATLTSGKSGLTPVIATSVAPFGGGTASVGPNGVINFANASTVYINGCFSAGFDNYRIIADVPILSAAAAILFRFRVANAEDSSANYNFQTLSAGVSTVTASQGVGFNFFQATNANGLACSVAMDIFAPAKPAVTRVQYQYLTQITGTNTQLGSIGGAMNVNTAYDGFTFFQSGSALLTGTIRVYGYNNN